MGVPRTELPTWDDIQFVTAQLATPPQLDDVPIGTELVVGPNALKPLRLKMPLFVSDMSFGALSEEAKTALARGAELAGTGICSGEGGMLPEEQAENSRTFMNWRQGGLDFPWIKSRSVRPSISKGGKGLRPELAAICLVQKSRAKSPRYVAQRRRSSHLASSLSRLDRHFSNP